MVKTHVCGTMVMDACVRLWEVVGSILWPPNKILNNLTHKWPMGGCHMATSHWSISHGLHGVSMSALYGLYGHATCHPCSGDTCHLDFFDFDFSLV
jgi:hypothetical protein